MIYLPTVKQGHATQYTILYQVDSVCLIYYLSFIINHSIDILNISTMFSLRDKLVLLTKNPID